MPTAFANLTHENCPTYLNKQLVLWVEMAVDVEGVGSHLDVDIALRRGHCGEDGSLSSTK
jgi:hypothetical protein